MIINGKYYYYKSFRMTKTTDKKLNVVKKKMGKKWNEVFIELIKAYNNLYKK